MSMKRGSIFSMQDRQIMSHDFFKTITKQLEHDIGKHKLAKGNVCTGLSRQV